MSLSITNIVRVTVLSSLRGLSEVNTSMLGLIVDEVPIPNDYGIFRAYKNPLDIANDWGSNSDAFRLGLMVFNQKPGILTGGGSLLIIPRVQSAAATPATIISEFLVDFTKLTADDYEIKLTIDGGAATDYTIGEIDATSLATIESSLNSTEISAAGATFLVSGEITKCRVTLKSDTTGATSALVVGTSVATGTNIAPLLGISGSAVGTAAGLESIKDCILRTIGLVPYFGLIYNEKMTDAILTSVSKLIQAYDIMQFVGSSLSADIAGIFTTLLNAGYNQTRMLYYSNSEADALDLAAGYAARGLSVNFSGVGTMITMNLKEITGIVPDPEFATSIAQTRYDACKVAGVDVYADFGVPGIASFGANLYFDEVYIRLAYKLKTQTAIFNFLKQNPTKTPQTEKGIDGLVATARSIAKQFVLNGSFAPGVWTSPTIFGDPEDHLRNIEEFGYWFYRLPLSLQPTADREARLAPVIQNANKLSGAVHGSDVTVYFER